MNVMKTIIASYNDHRQWRPFLTLFVFLIIYYESSLAATTSIGYQRIQDKDEQTTTRSGDELPTFEQTAPNVTAFEGQTVYLPCRVHNLGDKVVSWMRSRDLHILTSSEMSFSSDSRFRPQHLRGSDAWTLQLDHVKASDAGRYECQVNTEPKIMYAVQLTVKDPNKPDGYDEPHSQQTRISFESTAPTAAIMGPREQKVPAGTTITLKCVITSPYQTRPIKAVHWFLDNKLLTFQAARGGINVETVTGTSQTCTEATLANLTRKDSGKYSCRPTEGKADSIMLYVYDGQFDAERTEAMQRDASYSSSNASHHHEICLFIILIGIVVQFSESLQYFLPFSILYPMV